MPCPILYIVLPPSPGPTRLLLRVLSACALPALAACEDTVALGSECPAFAEACGSTSGGAMASGDGGHADSGDDMPGDAPTEPPTGTNEPDGGIALDAGPAEPPPPGDLVIQNGSFEVTFDATDEGFIFGGVEIAPWRWCQGEVSVSDEFGDHEASDGEVLLSLGFGAGFPVLSQELAQPLEAGRSYALAVDASRSDAGPSELRLVLYGGDQSCAETTVLVRSTPVVEDDDLRTYCLSFTPAQDVRHLVLAVDPLTLVGDLYLDNLRAEPGCAP